tara:strand:+ start:358 stop:651 length:294 start_codon:yes stop_codon:yes gene_type:complete
MQLSLCIEVQAQLKALAAIQPLAKSERKKRQDEEEEQLRKSREQERKKKEQEEREETENKLQEMNNNKSEADGWVWNQQTKEYVMMNDHANDDWRDF